MRLTKDNIADYADLLADCVRGGGYALDYSEESVHTLEHLTCLSDPQFQSPDLPQAHRDLAVFYNGCYLGEVMTRNLGGIWQFAEDWFDSSVIFTRREQGIQVYPFHKMHRRVTEGPESNSLTAYYQGLKERLAEIH